MNKPVDRALLATIEEEDTAAPRLLDADRTLASRFDRMARAILAPFPTRTVRPFGEVSLSERDQRELDGALIAAAHKADVTRINALIKTGANPNAIRRRYRWAMGLGRVADAHDSALLVALKGRGASRAEAALALVRGGADVAYVNRHGESACSQMARLRLDTTAVFGHADTAAFTQLSAEIRAAKRSDACVAP